MKVLLENYANYSVLVRLIFVFEILVIQIGFYSFETDDNNGDMLILRS